MGEMSKIRGKWWRKSGETSRMGGVVVITGAERRNERNRHMVNKRNREMVNKRNRGKWRNVEEGRLWVEMSKNEGNSEGIAEGNGTKWKKSR